MSADALSPDELPRTARCRVVHAVADRVRLRIERPELWSAHSELEAFLRRHSAVRQVRTRRSCSTVVVHCEGGAATAGELVELLERTPLAEVRRTSPGPNGAPEEPSSLRGVVLSSASAVLALAGESLVSPLLLLLAAVPIFQRACTTLFVQRRLNVDVLDASATALLSLQTNFSTAAAMVWMVTLGDYLRDLTRQHSVRTISSLYSQNPQFVWRVRDREKVRVPLQEIAPGDEIVVYPGEVVPLDGTVLRGEGMVDQRMLTGESIPVSKSAEAQVYAGTALVEGKLYVRADRIGEDTRASNILRMVLDAPTSETRSQSYAERFADRVVPWSLAGALGSWAAGGTVDAAASVLIVDFGTGIRVAAPTTVLSAMARAAHEGILIKGGRFLELLAEVDAVVFDKTGTLTAGIPQVVDVVSYGAHAVDEILVLCAAAEQRLTHPVATALMRAAEERGLSLPRRKDLEYAIGQGVKAEIQGRQVWVGSARFLESQGVDLACTARDVAGAQSEAVSQLFVALDGVLEGLALYRDPLRDDAAELVGALRSRGVRDLVMLTGDHPVVAEDVAQQLGIGEVIANAFPEQKAEVVERLKQQGRTVAVIGDGINDSPALAAAHVGISMYDGADVAQQTADVSLLNPSLMSVVRAIDVAREATALIQQGWRINCYANCAALALTAVGLSGPIATTALSNGAALVSALNAVRPLFGLR